NILNHAEPRMLIYESEFGPYVRELRKTCPGVQRFVSMDGTDDGFDMTYDDLLARGRIERPDLLSFDENDIAELFYTSGSTGTPKGVMLSHRTIFLHALSVALCARCDDTTVEMHTIPLFHA